MQFITTTHMGVVDEDLRHTAAPIATGSHGITTGLVAVNADLRVGSTLSIQQCFGTNAERTYWIANSYAEPYVKEAKRRKLSCGVGKVSQPIKKSSNSKNVQPENKSKKSTGITAETAAKAALCGGTLIATWGLLGLGCDF